MAWTADHSLGRTLKQYQQEYARAMAIELGNRFGVARDVVESYGEPVWSVPAELQQRLMQRVCAAGTSA